MSEAGVVFTMEHGAFLIAEGDSPRISPLPSLM